MIVAELWCEAAAEQIESIRDFISRDSRRNAERVAEHLRIRGDSIGPGPESGSIVPELDRNDVREVFIYSYRLIYQVRKTHVGRQGQLHKFNYRSCDFDAPSFGFSGSPSPSVASSFGNFDSLMRMISSPGLASVSLPLSLIASGGSQVRELQA